MAGEAAGFIDPLYSPGSDFIAYLNTFGGDLICRDLDGEDIEERLEFFNFFFFQLFDPTVTVYQDHYQLFGNPQVMMAKLLYDNLAYFATLAFLYLHGKMTELEDLGDVVDVFETAIPLLGRMQEMFRDWHALDQRKFEGVSVLSTEFEPFIRGPARHGRAAGARQDDRAGPPERRDDEGDRSLDVPHGCQASSRASGPGVGRSIRWRSA